MGLIHLDAGVVIGFLDRDDAHHENALVVLTAALRARDRLAMAASAFAECLVGPALRGDKAVAKVRELVERFPIAIVALDIEAAIVAARLRAAHKGLRLPDALVIATATNAAANQLITTDRRWPTAKALQLKTLITQL